MLANGRIWWDEGAEAEREMECHVTRVPLHFWSQQFVRHLISFLFTHPPSFHSSIAVRLLRKRQDEGSVCRGAPLAFPHQSWWTSSEKNLQMRRDKGERWGSTGKLRSFTCKCFITLKDTLAFYFCLALYTFPLFLPSLLCFKKTSKSEEIEAWKKAVVSLSLSPLSVLSWLLCQGEEWGRDREVFLCGSWDTKLKRFEKESKSILTALPPREAKSGWNPLVALKFLAFTSIILQSVDDFLY